jgi:hypothetical protein
MFGRSRFPAFLSAAAVSYGSPNGLRASKCLVRSLGLQRFRFIHLGDWCDSCNPNEEAKGTNIISRGDWSDSRTKMTIVEDRGDFI